MTVTDPRLTENRLNRLEQLCDQIEARLNDLNSRSVAANDLGELPPGMFPPTSEFSGR